MYQLGVAAIAGNRTRTSMFSMNAVDTFSPALAGGYSLGQTGQQIYVRAVAALGRFDSLVARTQRIANKAAREEVISTYGLEAPSNTDKALYTRNAVAGNVAEVSSYSPPNYLIYETRRGPNVSRVDRLEAFNRSFESDVKSAEDTYGILPEPVVIERLVLVPGEAAPASTNNWVVPVVALGAGLGIAALLGLFWK